MNRLILEIMSIGKKDYKVKEVLDPSHIKELPSVNLNEDNDVHFLSAANDMKIKAHIYGSSHAISGHIEGSSMDVHQIKRCEEKSTTKLNNVSSMPDFTSL